LNDHHFWRHFEVLDQDVGHLTGDRSFLFDTATFSDVNINFGHAFVFVVCHGSSSVFAYESERDANIRSRSPIVSEDQTPQIFW
jgi:hypothetical protein